MNQTDITPLVKVYHRRLATTSLHFKRHLYHQINWNARLIGIKGARGVGKTTLLLQYIKEHFPHVDDTLWVSLDNLWFKTHDVDELVEWLYTHGQTVLFFDEVHKCPDWTLRLKNYYDNYPDLRIVYTGSSMLEIDHSKVDLSRRQSLYTLPVMSFCEYLEFEGAISTPVLTLSDLLTNHVGVSMDICGRVKILKLFSDYLDHGQYPFYKEADQEFHTRLSSMSNLVIETDMPAVTEVTYATIEKTKKLLMIVSDHVPFVPNISRLCESLSTTRDMCLKMLYALDRADILSLLTRELKSYKHLTSPEKIYLANTNLMAALGSNADIGNLRETFFVSQVQHTASVQMPNKGDFLLEGKYLIEVGGAAKTFDQIKDEPHSYLAVDDIETGYGARIPLWMFGLLY